MKKLIIPSLFLSLIGLIPWNNAYASDVSTTEDCCYDLQYKKECYSISKQSLQKSISLWHQAKSIAGSKDETITINLDPTIERSFVFTAPDSEEESLHYTKDIAIMSFIQLIEKDKFLPGRHNIIELLNIIKLAHLFKHTPLFNTCAKEIINHIGREKDEEACRIYRHKIQYELNDQEIVEEFREGIIDTFNLTSYIWVDNIYTLSLKEFIFLIKLYFSVSDKNLTERSQYKEYRFNKKEKQLFQDLPRTFQFWYCREKEKKKLSFTEKIRIQSKLFPKKHPIITTGIILGVVAAITTGTVLVWRKWFS